MSAIESGIDQNSSTTLCYTMTLYSVAQSKASRLWAPGMQRQAYCGSWLLLYVLPLFLTPVDFINNSVVVITYLSHILVALSLTPTHLPSYAGESQNRLQSEDQGVFQHGTTVLYSISARNCWNLLKMTIAACESNQPGRFQWEHKTKTSHHLYREALNMLAWFVEGKEERLLLELLASRRMTIYFSGGDKPDHSLIEVWTLCQQLSSQARPPLLASFAQL